MTTNELVPAIATPTVSAILPGHHLIEVVGNEVRVWVALMVDGKLRVRQTHRSLVFLRKRVLMNTSSGSMVDAPDLTPTRLYKKDGSAAALIRKYFPDQEITTFHLFYSGRGPSGHMWNFMSNDHYTVTLP